MPTEWLHLTVQDVGFAGEVAEDDLVRIVAAVRRRCARLASVRVTLGPAVLVDEGMWLRVEPVAAVRQVHAAVRAGIAEVWVAGPAGGFTPHVSLAYSHTDGPSEPYAAALAGMAPRSATVEVGAIQLVELGRDAHLILVETVATIPFRFSTRIGPGCFDCRG